jgi:hypothetical protein
MNMGNSADHTATGATSTPRLVLGVDDAERSWGALLRTCAKAARRHVSNRSCLRLPGAVGGRRSASHAERGTCRWGG